jgi:hydroxymethylpyrimidine pyrophosphatase-like HAD family hydrolase
VFRDIHVCDAVVAENGGLLYWPAEDREEALAEAPSPDFVAELIAQNVAPFSVGRVIVATWRPHESKLLEIIQRLGTGQQIIFNKGAVMVLPGNINKATGLSAALRQLQIPPERVVGIGDAENDHVFLDACGVAVAVDNALPALKKHCDLVTSGDHGRGVTELVEMLIQSDLASLGPRRPRKSIARPANRHER